MYIQEINVYNVYNTPQRKVYKYIYTYVYIYISVYLYIYIYTYVCIGKCINVYTPQREAHSLSIAENIQDPHIIIDITNVVFNSVSANNERKRLPNLSNSYKHHSIFSVFSCLIT